MKVYSEMLNIQRAKDRKKLMIEELKSRNITAQFFVTVFSRNPDKKCFMP